MSGSSITRLIAVLLALACGACGERRTAGAGIEVGEILGNPDVEGFARAYQVRPFEFPGDHGPHPAFRNEWWYLTGNLRDDTGRRFGYQVTFFRNALLPPSAAREGDSAWRTSTLWMAHAALTDVADGKHQAEERFSRGAPGLAGAQLEPMTVWLENWQLASLGAGAHAFPWQLEVSSEGFVLALELSATTDPVLQGDRGLSQKGTQAGNASYYYSVPRLQTSGRISLAGRHFQVEGLSWLDREWSTSALEAGQTGWDWFALQLDDGGALMYYQLRRGSRGADPLSRGSWIDADGQSHAIPARDLRLRELDYWRAPDGNDYPVRWSMHWVPAGKHWLIEAVLHEQFNNLSVKYWEGAVDVRDFETSALRGQGYLEMTRGRRK